MPTMMKVVAALLLAWAPALAAQETAPDELVVATKVAEPFAIKEADGSWRGISIELWERIAEEAGFRYRYEELELSEMLDRVADGSVDIAAAGLTVTSERETRMDFTNTLLTSGLGIAVHGEATTGFFGVLRRFLSLEFLGAVGALAVLLLVVGALVWFFERKKNPEFGGRGVTGMGEGFWWSAVTMTTVGYGDKSPKTGMGRTIALVWMFASIIVISGFTAAIASSLTLSQLESSIEGVNDLPGKRVASVEGSTSADWLRARGLRYRDFPSVAAAVAALDEGRVDAVVYDAPMLRWLALNTESNNVLVLPVRLERQDYAFALPSSSPLREPVNRALLDIIKTEEWEQVLFEYLGG